MTEVALEVNVTNLPAIAFPSAVPVPKNLLDGKKSLAAIFMHADVRGVEGFPATRCSWAGSEARWKNL